MNTTYSSFKIAAVQACPVYLDLNATIDKACSLIRQAGHEGAALAAFPEAFVPGYPVWVWFIPPGHTAPIRELYARLVENSVTVPSEATDRLCATIGINERNAETSGSTLYNTLLYISAEGTILGKHRKLIPTAGERLVWGQGDGSDLRVYDFPFGKVGGLLCWENYMPLARYAMTAWGTEVLVAPTWDRGEPWLSTMRHSAKEGRCFVIGCCSAMRKDDIPDSLSFKEEYLQSIEDWVNPGLSVIVDPDGKIVAGPAEKEETILYAEVRRDQITGPRFQLDTVGHYARPDVFELRVHRTPRPMITEVEELFLEDSEAEST
jgi:nitrilase